jgi:hypothetical protein
MNVFTGLNAPLGKRLSLRSFGPIRAVGTPFFASTSQAEKSGERQKVTFSDESTL